MVRLSAMWGFVRSLRLSKSEEQSRTEGLRPLESKGGARHVRAPPSSVALSPSPSSGALAFARDWGRFHFDRES